MAFPSTTEMNIIRYEAKHNLIIDTKNRQIILNYNLFRADTFKQVEGLESARGLSWLCDYMSQLSAVKAQSLTAERLKNLVTIIHFFQENLKSAKDGELTPKYLPNRSFLDNEMQSILALSALSLIRIRPGSDMKLGKIQIFREFFKLEHRNRIPALWVLELAKRCTKAAKASEETPGKIKKHDLSYYIINAKIFYMIEKAGYKVDLGNLRWLEDFNADTETTTANNRMLALEILLAQGVDLDFIKRILTDSVSDELIEAQIARFQSVKQRAIVSQILSYIDSTDLIDYVRAVMLMAPAPSAAAGMEEKPRLVIPGVDLEPLLSRVPVTTPRELLSELRSQYTRRLKTLSAQIPYLREELRAAQEKMKSTHDIEGGADAVFKYNKILAQHPKEIQDLQQEFEQWETMSKRVLVLQARLEPTGAHSVSECKGDRTCLDAGMFRPITMKKRNVDKMPNAVPVASIKP